MLRVITHICLKPDIKWKWFTLSRQASVCWKKGVVPDYDVVPNLTSEKQQFSPNHAETESEPSYQICFATWLNRKDKETKVLSLNKQNKKDRIELYQYCN